MATPPDDAAVPTVTIANDNNHGVSTTATTTATTTTTTTSTTTTTNDSASFPQQQTQRKDRHAHWDCFSGAAGDMMLAACLDAAAAGSGKDHSTFVLRSTNETGDNAIDKTSVSLLHYVTETLRRGLPDMAHEFDLHSRRVWRGHGSIAATYVTVTSIYDHRAAVVPEKAGGEPPNRNARPTEAPSHPEHEHSHDHHNSDASHHHSHDHPRHHSDTTVATTTTRESSSSEHNDTPSTSPVPADHDSHGPSHNHAHSHSHTTSHAPHPDTTSRDTTMAAVAGPIRNLPEIRRLLDTPAARHHFSPWVRHHATTAFTLLAHAEATVHGAASLDAVHFHEVGAVDSIVDTVGTLVALDALQVGTVSCSRVPLGCGTVWTAHGRLPVPAPATLHLLHGMAVTAGPMASGELVTPTAAALLKALLLTTTTTTQSTGRAVHDGRPPDMTVCAVGVGAGTKDFDQHPNIVRLILGENVAVRP